VPPARGPAENPSDCRRDPEQLMEWMPSWLQSRRVQWSLLGTLLALIAGAVAWRLRPARLEPLAPSAFASCTMVTLPDRVPIGDVLELQEGTGTYAEIHITRATAVPEQHDDAAVQEFVQWPVSLWIYPVGEYMSDGYCAPTCRWASPDGKRPPYGLSKGGDVVSWMAQATNFQGPLPRPKDHPTDPNLIACWTYIAPIRDRTGDLVYELSVYPAASRRAPSKPMNYRRREILKRGIVRVLPSTERLADNAR